MDGCGTTCAGRKLNETVEELEIPADSVPRSLEQTNLEAGRRKTSLSDKLCKWIMK